MNLFDTRGKVAISVLFFGILVAAAVLAVQFFATDSLQHARFAIAQSTATTTVNVLNTPPLWTENAFENPPSSSSTPTNVGSQVTWNGIGTDPNSDAYYLLICKTSGLPTAAPNAAPSCNGGAGNQWAVSTSTNSGATSTASYTTLAGDAQLNIWYGWICDGNAGGATCNSTFTQGPGGASSTNSSPFVVNHRPVFQSFSNNSPAIPGAIVTWSSVASDTDNFLGASDTIQLFVCKATDFTGTGCGSGGSYCSSPTSSVTSNPTCTSSIPIPTQDQGYSSFGYIIDQHLFAASGGAHGTNSTETVSAVAPTIASSSIFLLNVGGSSTPLSLTNPGGQTSGFQVAFTASDNNSCLNAAGGQEVATATIDVYRLGIGLASCQTSGNYNPSSCYPSGAASSTWVVTCTQNVGSCTGSSTINVGWTCTFPLWYVADPTDGTATSTQFPGTGWYGAVQATNWVGQTSTVVQGATTNTVLSFLASQLNTPAINFGSLPPGSTTPTLAASTTLSELGNLGLNETLYGVDMCSNFPGCPVSPTSTIPVGSINYGTSSVAYASGVSLLTSPGALLAVQIQKSTSTATSSLGGTFWGLSVPAAIQLSGAYTGQNTFVAVRSSPSFW